jgi:AraC family transcriptional regulator
MACAIHQGSYARLNEAYGSLMTWMEINGYRMAGPNRDVYLSGPEDGLDDSHGVWDSTQYVTEVQFPVSKKPVSTFVSHYVEEKQMEVKIVTMPAFTVVGMEYRGKNEKDEIPQLWAKVNPRMSEIKHPTEGCRAYGVCGESDEDGSFRYVAGLEVEKAEDVPSGMTSWEVPEQQYAVFPCTLPTIGQAYEYAFQTWLPQSDYKRADGPDFELYDEEFEVGVEGSPMYIYVPIEK